MIDDQERNLFLLKTQNKKHKHPYLRNTLIGLSILGLASITAVAGVATYVIHTNATSTEKVVLDLAKKPISRSVQITDINNQPLSTDANTSYYVPSHIGKNQNVPDLYLKALIAVEDKNFYTRQTRGYDIKGIGSAGLSYLKSKLGKGITRGGSTIDQQLVKTLMLGGANAEESLNRKVVEILESHEMARSYSRDEILTAYIDSIRLTPDTIGVSAAWSALFEGDFNTKDNKTPEHIAKMAYMAGLGQQPSVYISKFDTLGKRRTRLVLGIMKDDGLISKKEYTAAIAYTNTSFKLKPIETNAIDPSYQPYLVAVKSELDQLNLPTYAKIKVKTWTDVNKLKELDNIAKFKSAPVTDASGQTLPDGTLTAITAIDTATGHVVGMATNSENPLTPITSQRSSGSSIKPILDYAPAIEFAGLTQNSILNGNTTTYSDGTPLANYGMYNYGGVTARLGVGLSLNTAAYQAFKMTTLAQKNAILRPLGLAKDNFLESESLGLNVSTLQQASAYQAVGNDGLHIEPTTLAELKVDDKPWPLTQPRAERAMSSRTSVTLIDMMQGVTAPNGSEPHAAQPQWPNAFAAKSGLVGFDTTKTNEIVAKYGNIMPASDAWMAATTSGVSIATWLGTPDLTGNTFIVGGGIQPENNGRVYLLNNALRLMNPGSLPAFKHGNEVLTQSVIENAIPEVTKPDKDLTTAITGFKPINPTVNSDLQNFYNSNHDKPILDTNSVFDNSN